MMPSCVHPRAAVAASFNMSLDRRCVCPIIVTKGNDQTPLSSKYQDRGKLRGQFQNIRVAFSFPFSSNVQAFPFA